jgi:hypothetical protein
LHFQEIFSHPRAGGWFFALPFYLTQGPEAAVAEQDPKASQCKSKSQKATSKPRPSICSAYPALKVQPALIYYLRTK